ncbi:MAG TPA: hypothetical protein PKC28_07265, partial [Bdellovibrionales bacterium]|nr:hypothetical protein [Bdellovibrionales bacterium]
YWVNDSGDKGHLYMTARDGSNKNELKIKHYRPRDVEALAAADCPEGPCLVIGDIGDNRRKRKHIELAFVLEKESFPHEMATVRRLELRYPDGPHDAEAMVILPSGDLLIITKELRLSSLSAAPAVVFTLPRAELHQESQAPKILTKLGELPLPDWLALDGFVGQVATDAAIHPRRQVLGILTYNRAVEIPLAKLSDLAGATRWKRDVDYALVPLKPLGQQETMTYLRDTDELVWSTELVPPDSPIFSMTCRRALP